jgi:hypothetical protein
LKKNIYVHEIGNDTFNTSKYKLDTLHTALLNVRNANNNACKFVQIIGEMKIKHRAVLKTSISVSNFLNFREIYYLYNDIRVPYNPRNGIFIL